MTRLSGHDLRKIGVAISAMVVLTLVCAACSAFDSTTTGSIAPQVEMLALPGGGGKVPMPPAWMRQQIEQRMRQGRVPGFVEVPAAKIRSACVADEDLLGCMINLQGLKVTYIRSGLSAELKHMVLLHEYAHDLYDWKH